MNIDVVSPFSLVHTLTVSQPVFLYMVKPKLTEKRQPKASDWDKVRMMWMRNEELDYILSSFPEVAFNKNMIVKKMSKEGITAKRRSIQERAIDDAAKIAEKDKLYVNALCIDLYNKGADIIAVNVF